MPQRMAMHLILTADELIERQGELILRPHKNLFLYLCVLAAGRERWWRSFPRAESGVLASPARGHANERASKHQTTERSLRMRMTHCKRSGEHIGGGPKIARATIDSSR